MSRINLPSKVPGRTVVVGKDRSCGLFIQVFPNLDDLISMSDGNPDRLRELEDLDEPLVDRDQLAHWPNRSRHENYSTCTANEWVNLIHEYAVVGEETWKVIKAMMAEEYW